MSCPLRVKTDWILWRPTQTLPPVVAAADVGLARPRTNARAPKALAARSGRTTVLLVNVRARRRRLGFRAKRWKRIVPKRRGATGGGRRAVTAVPAPIPGSTAYER